MVFKECDDPCVLNSCDDISYWGQDTIPVCSLPYVGGCICAVEGDVIAKGTCASKDYCPCEYRKELHGNGVTIQQGCAEWFVFLQKKIFDKFFEDFLVDFSTCKSAVWDCNYDKCVNELCDEDLGFELQMDYNDCPKTCQDQIKKDLLGDNSVTCDDEEKLKQGCVCKEGLLLHVKRLKILLSNIDL